MSPMAIVQLVQMLWPLILQIIKLGQDLKDGHYDGAAGEKKFVEHSKEIVQQVQDAHKKAA